MHISISPRFQYHVLYQNHKKANTENLWRAGMPVIIDLILLKLSHLQI